VSTLAFVDSIATNPGIRLDLADGAVWAASGESEFPGPPLKRSSASTLITDGEPIPASAYSNREIRLVLKLLSDSSDAAASQYQMLVRELDRPTNILRYHPTGATEAVFFRTFRGGPEALVWLSEDIVKEVVVSLIAEPFALGVRETLGATTVSNNPAAGANGCYIDYTGVKGDVETPLVLTYNGNNFSSPFYYSPGLACGVRTGAAPYPTLFRQAESLTLGTDTTAVADATHSGGSKARCTFANNSYLTRVSGTFPTATVPAGAENRGVYRVFARVQATVLSTFKIGIAGSNSTSDYALNTYAQILDLGTLSASTAFPVSSGYDSVRYSVTTLPTINFGAQRVSGTGSLDIDYILLIPADESYGSWGQLNTLSATAINIVDSVNEAVYCTVSPFTSTPQMASGLAPAAFAGVYPYIRPGDNRVVIFQHTPADGSGVGSRITDSLSVTGYYWPRYLHVRPATT
jgi:hypothetical protein